MGNKSTNLIWIDLEMTGLDTFSDVIIEIATIVTDVDLNLVAEGPAIAIYQPDRILEAMDEWNTTQHGRSGLTQRVRESTWDTQQAEQATIEFLRRNAKSGHSPMCGNTICQDRRFLARLMPELEAFFHYRNLDVSSLKELARRWAPEVARGFNKESSHLAMQDIRDSIAELRWYREHFLKLPLASGGT